MGMVGEGHYRPTDYYCSKGVNLAPLTAVSATHVRRLETPSLSAAMGLRDATHALAGRGMSSGIQERSPSGYSGPPTSPLHLIGSIAPRPETKPTSSPPEPAQVQPVFGIDRMNASETRGAS